MYFHAPKAASFVAVSSLLYSPAVSAIVTARVVTFVVLLASPPPAIAGFAVVDVLVLPVALAASRSRILGGDTVA